MKRFAPVFCVLMIVLGAGLIGGAAPQTTILDLAYDVLPAAAAAPEPTPALPISTRHTGAGGGCASGRCPYAPVPAESIAKPVGHSAGKVLRPLGRVLRGWRRR
jgi:hypothetical protein